MSMRFILAASLLLLFSWSEVREETSNAARDETTMEYVCPMPEHPRVFQKAGTCPECGMRLVERKAVKKRRNVAILVFEGVQIIDFSAPYEVFGQAHFNVFTVGPTHDAVTTAMGLKVTPTYAFGDAPPAEIIVLPGGNVNVDDHRIVDWVRAREAQSEVTLSVCNGAFWLAKAGLLDGLTATTFHGLIDELVTAAPKARIVRDKRFIDNGRIVTSAGLTSGMDGALHVIEKLLGRDKARAVALQLEYDWRPESTYARANLADRYIPHLELGPDVEVTTSLGDVDQWRLEAVVGTKEAAGAFLARVENQLTSRARWRREGSAGDGGRTQRWGFADDQGRAWRGMVAVAAGEREGSLKVTLQLERGERVRAEGGGRP
jgi:putative intracellular protease/amidase